jgi:OOP family OmpA-OmpF porin
MKTIKRFAAALIGVAPLAATAQGSQLAYEGPYIEAGTGANFSRDQRVYNSAGQPVGTLQYDGGIPATLAAGYALANGWRGDLEFGYRSNDVDSAGQANEGSVDVGTLMAMVWFDWPVTWRFRPYAGAGAGTAELDLNDAGGPGGGDGSDQVFAWQLSMGVASQLTQRLALTLGYRLLTTDDARFADGDRRAEYQSDSAMLGLRYFFQPVKRMRMADAAESAGTTGAPAAATQAPAAEVAAFETVTLRPVNFKFDQAELTEPAQQTLDQIAREMLKEPGLKVVIDGHADRIGSSEYNLALSERRANAVRDYLAAKGVDVTVLDIRAFGENQPVADNTSVEGRAQNRRAEVNTAAAPPANVKIVIEPPTEASKEAAQGDDPGLGDKAQPEAPAGGETNDAEEPL